MKKPGPDIAALPNRAFQKQDCNNWRNSLNHTCKLPYFSVRCQVAKMQNTADVRRFSVTNTLPVSPKRGRSFYSGMVLSNSGLNKICQMFVTNR